jgi:hypothetical protein
MALHTMIPPLNIATFAPERAMLSHPFGVQIDATEARHHINIVVLNSYCVLIATVDAYVFAHKMRRTWDMSYPAVIVMSLDI